MRNLFVFLLLILIAGRVSAQTAQLKINVGHSDEVNTVCFSPDDKYIASCSDDKTIKLWDVATLKELKTFTSSTSIQAISFSKDGKSIFSGGEDGLKMWNIETEEVEILNSQCYPHFIDISSDGRYIAYDNIYKENTLDIFDVQTRMEIKTIAGHKNYIQSASFSPDGKYIVSGGDDKILRLWDCKTGLLVKKFLGHESAINSVKFSPDGKYIASASCDENYRVKVWSVLSGKVVKAFSQNTNSVSTVCFSNDGKYLVSGGAEGIIYFWDLSSGAMVKSYPNHFIEFISSLSFSHDGKYLVCGKTDKTLGLWDLSTNEETLLPGNKLQIPTVFFAPDGKSVLNTNDDIVKKNLSVKKWSWLDAQKVSTNEGVDNIEKKLREVENSYFNIVGYSNDHSKVICYTSFDNSSKVDIVNLTTSKIDYSFYVEAGIDRAVLSPDEKYLAIEGFRDIKLYSIESGTIIKSVKAFIDWSESINFSPDGKYLVSGGSDSIGNVVKVWEIPSFSEVLKINGHVNAIYSVCYSSDGKYIVSGSCDGYIKIWNALNGAEVRSITGEIHSMISSVNFSPDGKYLVSGHYNDEYAVKLWDFETGNLINTFNGHTGGVKSVNFSPDGKFIVSSGEDGSVKIWDIATGECKISRYDVPNTNDWVVVTPDGRFDGTDGGMKLLYYVKGLEVIPLESFYEKFYTPGLAAQVMSGNRDAVFNLQSLGNDIKLPPTVKILSPTTNDKFKTDQVEVVIEATDQGGGVDEIRLYQNGKLVSEDQRGMRLVQKTGEKVTKKYSILLVSGTNELKATAFNTDRTEAIPTTVNIELEKAIATSDLYIVSIGINKYKNEKYNLAYSVPDADAFTQAITTKSKGIFNSIKPVVLKDEQCTKEGILSQFDALSKVVKPEDVFIFYYAGHGVMSEGSENIPSEFYFVPFNVTQMYGSDDMLQIKGISASELRNALINIKAQKQLIVMDACQSGGATELLATRGAAEEKALMQLARSAGIAVLASTGTAQYASEVKQLGHGIFTYSILEGLSGKADGGTKDGKITIKELAAFLEDNVPELTKKYRGTSQYPNTSIRGMDFPIVIGQ